MTMNVLYDSDAFFFQKAELTRNTFAAVLAVSAKLEGGKKTQIRTCAEVLIGQVHARGRVLRGVLYTFLFSSSSRGIQPDSSRLYTASNKYECVKCFEV